MLPKEGQIGWQLTFQKSVFLLGYKVFELCVCNFFGGLGTQDSKQLSFTFATLAGKLSHFYSEYSVAARKRIKEQPLSFFFSFPMRNVFEYIDVMQCSTSMYLTFKRCVTKFSWWQFLKMEESFSFVFVIANIEKWYHAFIKGIEKVYVPYTFWKNKWHF